MAELDIRATDLVVVRLTLRGRDGGDAVSINETVSVADLGLGGDEAAAAAPAFDGAEYARLMAQGAEGNPAATEAALQMLASLNQETADFVAAGGTPPAESLAEAVVNWVVETRPDDHQYTTDANDEGYVISTREINIHGPVVVDEEAGERLFRVTAVGTWGVCA